MKRVIKETNIKENIQERAIEDELKDDYLEYSMSVITDRAIPHLKDGLKPIQRRILYAMRNTDSFVKCARTVGEVIGKYSPHGDTSAFGALVRLAQPFRMYVPYVVGQGNFGSLDAQDSPAAMRYVESKINDITQDIFFKYNQLGTEYKDNYDGSTKEPVHLVPVIPTILINGAIGMAVGFATSMPTHNPIEVLNAYEAYINGELKLENIRKYL